MATKFPRRSDSHQLDEISERFIRNALPRRLTHRRSLNTTMASIYESTYSGRGCYWPRTLMQLKASAKPGKGDAELMRLKTATFNHLRSKLQVVMLVKYVEQSNEAYWLLLKDIDVPPADQSTFTVRVPKANCLSVIDWPAIQAHRAERNGHKTRGDEKSRIETRGQRRLISSRLPPLCVGP